MPANNPFLAEGLIKYPEALETVSAFELQMRELLRVVFLARNSKWLPFQGSPKISYTIGRSEQQSYWISAIISGPTLRAQEAIIDTGFWWRAEMAYTPALYAQIYKKPRHLQKFSFKSSNGIKSFESKSRTVLFRDDFNPDTIADHLNAILDEILLVLQDSSDKKVKS